MGYHKKKIIKGKLGEFSKIREEFEELEDAVKQGDRILQICELTDLYGAMEYYVNNFNLTMDDLKNFSDKTKQAFKDGSR
jgi:phosphoribosyl-ATP pyrophosphohydrolase